MATIISRSQPNLMIMGCKRAFPSSCTRKVTCINFPNLFNYNCSNYNSRPLSSSTVYHCTSSSFQENYYHTNSDGYIFYADKFMMMMIKPKCTNKPPRATSRNFVDIMSRILASLLTHGIVFTFVTITAFLYTSNSALALSYGRIGGGSLSSSSSSSSSGRIGGGSSSSFSSGHSSFPYYSYGRSYCSDRNEIHTCTCDTSCTHCMSCDIREKGYKQEEEKENNSCSCNCHSTCYFHKQVDQEYILLACIIIAVIAHIAAGFISGMESDDYGTMLIFQVGVLDKKRILQRNLNNIAENADTSTVNGLNCTLKDVVRALLQHDNSSLNYCYLSWKYQSMERLSNAFQEIFNGVLHGYDEDDNTLGNINGVKYKKRTNLVMANRSIDNEYTMATIMVLATGHHLIPKKEGKGKKYVDSLAVLQTLQRIPRNKLQSVEVLWSPQKEDEVLLEEEIQRYTTMERMENGHIFLI